MILNSQSKKKLETVDPALAKVIDYAAATAPDGVEFQVVQGNRTASEQRALYAQGRTKPGKRVTWTLNSNHMGGRAIDFQAYVNGRPTWTEKYFPPVAQHIKKAAQTLGVKVEWGYDLWNKDYGHIQLAKGASMSDIKKDVPPSEAFDYNKLLQIRLVLHGYDLVIDGDFGKKSMAAMADFQKRLGLKDTRGKLDDSTWNFLKALSNSEKSVKYLRDKGLTKAAACALVGGFQQESYKWLDPTAVGDKNEKDWAYGVSQVRGSRKVGLDQLALKRGTKWDDLETQLEYAWQELKTSEKRAGYLLIGAETLEEAAQAAIMFFRPKGSVTNGLWTPLTGHGYSNRLENARVLFRLLKP